MKIASIGLLLISFSLFFMGYLRIKSSLYSIEDAYVAHFGNVGLLYFIIGLLFFAGFFISNWSLRKDE